MVWKREEPLRPTSVPVNPAQAPSYSPVLSGGFDLTQGEQRPMNEELASIGKSIVINGELSGSEDLTIEGQVEGKIELREHVLTVGSNGRIKANGSVDGDIVAPRVAIADGSHFRGSIDMQRKEQSSSKQPSSVERTLGAFSKPEPKPSVPPATSVTNDLIRV